MYLSAQRVVSPSSMREGINAFCYLHGSYTWTGEAPRDLLRTHAGILVNSNLDVPPPGNRVRSYLDILTPDETPTVQIRSEVLGAVAKASPKTFPWRHAAGRTTLVFGAELAFVPGWPRELESLLNAALDVRRA